MITILIQIVVVALVCGLVLWLIQQFPLPDPFGRIARVGIMVIGVIVIVLLLLRMLGVSDIALPPPTP